MSEIQELQDLHGNIRRLGSLEPDAGRLRAFAENTLSIAAWSEADLKKVVSDANRTASREIFGPEWICDQLSFGSCNGWAAAATYSRARYLRGVRDGVIRFSGSYVYSWINGNRDQGSMLSDSLDEIERRGVPPESLVPANRIYRSQMPSGADQIAAQHKGFKCYPVRSLPELRTALANRWPCVVAIHAGGNFQRLGSGGVLGVDKGRGNHAVCVDDLRWSGGQWLYDMPNSWGVRFGDNGRGYLTDEHFQQTIGVHTFWAMPTTTEG